MLNIYYWRQTYSMLIKTVDYINSGISELVDVVLQNRELKLQAFPLADAQDKLSCLRVFVWESRYCLPVIEAVLRESHSFGVLAQDWWEAEAFSHWKIGSDYVEWASFEFFFNNDLSSFLVDCLIDSSKGLGRSSDFAHEDGFKQGGYRCDL